MSVAREVRIPRHRGLMSRVSEMSTDITFRHSGRYETSTSRLDSAVKPNSFENFCSRSVSSSNTESEDESIEGYLHKTTTSKKTFYSVNDNPRLLSSKKISSSSAKLCVAPPNASLEMNKNILSRQSSGESPLKSIQEDDTDEVVSFASTQHLRTGFFRSIKRQYPSLGFDGFSVGDNSTDSGNGDSLHGSVTRLNEDTDTYENKVEVEEKFMSSMARKRLHELRKVDPTKVDVATGLQWIRLELHEMREQDKSLFLQLIKLHTTIKELRTEMNCSDHDSDGSYDDINDAASLWWPRSNSVSLLPNFSSSDGAQLMKGKVLPGNLRRGMSLNYRRLPSYGNQSTPMMGSYKHSATLSPPPHLLGNLGR